AVTAGSCPNRQAREEQQGPAPRACTRRGWRQPHAGLISLGLPGPTASHQGAASALSLRAGSTVPGSSWVEMSSPWLVIHWVASSTTSPTDTEIAPALLAS